MKNQIEGYLSKSKLKNTNTLYKDFNFLNNKQKLPLLNLGHKTSFYIKKKNKSSEHSETKPINNQYKTYKNLRDKLLLNFKIKLKQKLKNKVKSPVNLTFTSKNLKLYYNNSSFSPLKSENSINFFNDYEKDFFSESIYSNLKYNEYEIYKSKAVYENLIQKKIIFLKENKNENKDIKLEKNFHYGEYNKEINLSFDSLIITFQDMSLPPELQDKKLKIYFPFELLPIFYYKGIEAFIKFLSVVIKIENNFEKITFDENKVMEALKNLKDYKTINGESNASNGVSILEITKNNVEENEQNIEIRPAILKKNNDFLKFNNFIFFWISNTRTFITTITLPCIHLNILENKISINHFINYELLFYLYKKNFVNWEFYIIKYLSTYSKFRKIFQQIGSHSKIYNKEIYFTQPKSLINTFAQEKLINVYSDPFGKNQIIMFKSFYIKATLIDLIFFQEKTYNIYFNFYHFVKLYEISKYSSKIFFLMKFLEINKDMHTLNFNYQAYDEFNIKDWMFNIKKFSDESLNINNNIEPEELYREFKVFPKKIKIEYIRPKWSIIKLENKNEIMKTWEIGKELEKELIDSIVDSGSKSWTNLLNECLLKLNEPVPNLPHIDKTKVKKKKSKKSIVFQLDTSKKLKKRFSKVSK